MDRTSRINRPLHGRVKTLFFQEGYGFLESEDGRDIYFHENSVLNNRFTVLEKGMEVVYSEEMGEKGPQASSLKPVGRNGYHAFPRHRTGPQIPDSRRPSIPMSPKQLQANFGGHEMPGNKWLFMLVGAALGAVVTYLIEGPQGRRLVNGARQLTRDSRNWITKDDMRSTGARGSELASP